MRLLRLLELGRYFRFSSPLAGIGRAFFENRLLYAGAFSFLGGATLIGSGWYEETYRRAADGWLIATMRLRRHRVELDGVVIFPRS